MISEKNTSLNKSIETRITLALMELTPIVDEDNPLEDEMAVCCNVETAIYRLEPVLEYFRALNKPEVN
ncbi:hypothetical protein [Acetobacterium sp.]|uniref:hypothetical protein n=1 Tax=Acetobacterium sp. TaxID=1872094 RepID=UPI0027283AB2|nr:hypothetical protein [Acetobacterium sp.]MDO9491106.1 hypothetical protein [Acetobacterium sp.]